MIMDLTLDRNGGRGLQGSYGNIEVNNVANLSFDILSVGEF